MKYTITRSGQALGTHTLDEVRALAQTGQFLPADLASAEDGASPVSVGQLVAPAAAAIPPPAMSSETFLVRRGTEQFGPYSLADFKRYGVEGRFLPTDVAWTAGMAAWEPVAQVLQRRGVTLPPRFAENKDESLKWVIPVGRSGLAIAAGYLGLFSVLLFPAPIALTVGILALRDLKKNPTKGGVGRAWFGVIAGALFTIGLLFSLAAIVFDSKSSP